MSGELTAAVKHLDVVICCGSGGVGKTTISAATGLALAARADKRVLVLTVDPARRLATALGLGAIGDDPVVVSGARLRHAGLPLRGEVLAAQLDAKSAWDRMIRRYASSDEVAQRILANRFYQGISEAFVGSHEYMVMEALYELHAAHEYDTVVIDTPPSRNALDLLEAPENLTDFVGGKLLSWLAGGSRVGFRALNLAARPIMAMADRLLGAEVLDELAEFIGDIQQMYGGVQRRARDVSRLLHSPAVGFVVVSSLEQRPFHEAEYFAARLRERRLPLRGIVLNRVLPEPFEGAAAARLATEMVEDEELADWLTGELGLNVSRKSLAAMGQGFLAYHRLAREGAQQRARLSNLGRVPVATVPLIAEHVSALEALVRIAQAL